MVRESIIIGCLASSGCIIVEHPPPRPAQPGPTTTTARPAATRPGAAAAPTTTVASTRPPPRIFLGGGAGSAGGAPSTDAAPKITSPIPFGNGTGGAFRGLAYVIPENTTTLPNLSQLVPFATLYTDSFQVQPQAFSGGFPGVLAQESWFAIRYEGAFSAPKDANYQFKLLSDDGAVLFVDGQKVVDNDGQHSVKPAVGQKELKAGSHRLRLEYFQAQKGNVALVLLMGEGTQAEPLVGTK